jgi:uncharacterized protein involved in exopolysaccharide biosynthesis
MDDAPSTPVTRQAGAREFLAVVFRRKALILGLFLTTTATILVLALSRPVLYQSTGRVLVKRGEKESLLESGRRYLQWEEELASEVQVIQSQTVVERAQAIVDEAAGGHSPLRVRADGIGAEVVGESNVILIAYSDRDPVVARTVADALVKAYVEYRNQAYTLPYPKAFFDGEIKKVTEQLAQITEERRQFATSADAVNPVQQSSQLLSQQQGLRQRLTEVESDLAAQRSMLETMRRMAANPEEDLALSTGPSTVADNTILELRRQILVQQTRLTQLRERYLDESAEVRTVQQTLASLRQMLQSEIRSRIEGAESLVRSIEERRRVVLAELTQVEARLKSLPTKESYLSTLDQRIAVLRNSYEELARNSDLARIAQATSSNITLILLSPPGRAVPTNTRDYVRLALAPVFSLLVGLGLAFFVDSLDSTVRTAAEAEQALGLPVLATLAERRRHARAASPA